MGSLSSNRQDPPTVALPLVYSFLSSKEAIQYKVVLKAVRYVAATFGLNTCKPQRIMTDVEKSILNACSEVFGDDEDVSLSCCLFHFSVFTVVVTPRIINK